MCSRSSVAGSFTANKPRGENVICMKVQMEDQMTQNLLSGVEIGVRGEMSWNGAPSVVLLKSALRGTQSFYESSECTVPSRLPASEEAEGSHVTLNSDCERGFLHLKVSGPVYESAGFNRKLQNPNPILIR